MLTNPVFQLFAAIAVVLGLLELFKKSPVSNYGFAVLVVPPLFVAVFLIPMGQHIAKLGRTMDIEAMRLDGHAIMNMGGAIFAISMIYCVTFIISNIRASNRSIQPMIDYIVATHCARAIVEGSRRTNWTGQGGEA